MMRSLYSGVTGLRNHQTRMDVIGNNIANVNTIGFKSSRVIFQDIYSQTIKPASTTGGGSGGTNPQQIGLGVQMATIDVLHSKSTPQYTGNTLDFSIGGDGYFIISSAGQFTYTRAGNFYADLDDRLVDANGAYVQGFEVEDEKIVLYDAIGERVFLDEDGVRVLEDGDPYTGTHTDPTAWEPRLTNIHLDPSYYDISINASGQVVGIDKLTNNSRVIGQLALATFANPNGLEKVGESSYRVTVNSGEAMQNTPGVGTGGLLNPGTLEMSNVDLTSEFADMIVTQRGFQANSRIITTTDQMLEEIVNMVR